MKQSNQTIIKGGHVIDPKNEINAAKDIYIQDQNIVGIQDPDKPLESFSEAQIIDASKQIVCPGLVDLRNRLREPGFKHKGTIASETYAAVSGGVTSLCCPPDTKPVIDSTAVIKQLHIGAQNNGLCHVYPMAAMTKGLEGKELSEMYTLIQAGCVGVSNAMHPISNTLVMRRVMEYAASHQIRIFLHPQNYFLSHNGCAHEGQVSSRLGLTGIPESAETIALFRDLELIELTGVKAHICQLSTARGVDIVRQAKKSGLNVTCDITSHHLYLTEMDIDFFNGNCHVIPPLRTQRDQDALRQGVLDNTIDAIVSDHQPHDADAKLAPFAETEPGMSTIETFLPLALKLTEQTSISLPELISKLTIEPAKILGIDSGTLDKGSIADICIIDPEQSWQVNREQFLSHGKKHPIHGWELQGKVNKTLVEGRVVFAADEK